MKKIITVALVSLIIGSSSTQVLKAETQREKDQKELKYIRDKRNELNTSLEKLKINLKKVATAQGTKEQRARVEETIKKAIKETEALIKKEDAKLEKLSEKMAGGKSVLHETKKALDKSAVKAKEYAVKAGQKIKEGYKAAETYVKQAYQKATAPKK